MTKSEVREKFAHKDYPIHVIGRHLEITDPMKSYAVDKLIRIERFGGRVNEISIIMDIQKLVHSIDFIVDVNNTIIKVSGRSESMYTSVDLAIEHLETKLRRYVDRLHDHHAKKLSQVDIEVNVVQVPLVDEINDEIEEENYKKAEDLLRPHEVVSRKKITLKDLSVEDAIMKMELSEDSFLVYRSEADQKLKVIYRRDDGNYGIIELPA